MADGITPETAAAELLRRRRARANIVDYSQGIVIPGAPVSEDEDEWLFNPIESSVSAHHILTMRKVQECIEQDYGRLMIFEPPGSAKSTYGAVVAPTWAMGKYPGLRVLMTSYAGKPIIRASKKARQICSSRQYRNIWETPTEIVRGSNAADEWELTNGSGLFAAGLLGGITSSRCDLGIIDDPVAGREEAESDTVRKKTLESYYDDFLTRLKPKASVIIIQTRWHQDDLAGSILPMDYKGQSGPILCRDGQTWEVLSIPAQADSQNDPLGRVIGDYLWPEWFSARHWEMYKSKVRTWASLYQQQPVPDEGTHFKRKDFKRFDLGDQPDGMTHYLASDFATKDGEGDFTTHGIAGVDGVGDIWFLAGYRRQAETDKTIDAALDLILKWKPALWFGEKGPIENSIGPAIKRQMRRRQIYAARELLASIANKVQRARGLMGRVSAGTVWVANGEWGDQLIEELIAFPGGRTDDSVDMATLIGRALDLLMDGKQDAAEEVQPKNKPFSRRHIEGLNRRDESERKERENYYT